MRRFPVVVVCVVSLAVLGAACSSSEDASPSTVDAASAPITAVASTVAPTVAPSTTPAAPPTTADSGFDPVVEAAVLEAYRGAHWVLFDALADPSNPPVEEINRWRTGNAKERLFASVDRFRDQGLRGVLPNPTLMKIDPMLVSLDPESALVSDCYTDDSFAENTDTGEISQNELVTSRWDITLILVDGEWKASSFERTSRTPGETACDK